MTHVTLSSATADGAGEQARARANLRRAAAATGIFLALLVAWQASGQGTEFQQGAVSDAGFVLGAALAAISCWHAARRSAGRTRLAWLLLALGAGCWALANVVWTYFMLVVGEIPMPGPPDAGYLSALPLITAGLLAMVPVPGGLTERLRTVVDGFILATSLLLLSWIFVLQPLWQTSEGPLGYRLVALVYPVGDVVLITVAVILALGDRPGRRLPFLLVATGMLLYGVSDSGLAYLSVEGQYRQGTVLDAGWIAGYLLLALAALAARGCPAEVTGTARPRSYVAELLPYVPAVVALGVYHGLHFAAVPSGINLGDPVLQLLAAALVAQLVLRMVMTIVHDGRLARTLEHQVRMRTRDLERLGRQHASILESAGDGILGLDPGGTVTFVNGAAADLLRRQAGDVVGRHIHDVAVHLSDDGTTHPWEQCSLRQMLSGASGWDAQTGVSTLRRIDGSRIDVEFTATPIVEDDLTAVSVVVFRDVTSRLVVERMKEEFISVVSHELRTPLTSIRGALGLLASGVLGALPAKGQRMVDVAVESSDRLIRLINDILDVERIAAGKLTLHRRMSRAEDLIAGAVQEMRGLAEEAGVTLQAPIREGAVWADPDRIAQVLANLLSNAVKFSAPGSRVTVSSLLRNGEVLFQVADEGRGIPADKLESVFGRFQQVDASDSREKGGTGLGLAICRGLVEQHGGRIWAESEPGRGATFSFTLPVASMPAEQGHQARGPAMTGTVLVCDDDPATLEVLAALLESQGYPALRAVTGEQAVDLAARYQPAAIVLDLLMPGMSGWETAAALKERPETAAIPIVIVSALRRGETRVDGEEPDVVAWVPKPPDPSRLLAALEEAMESRSGPRVLIVEDDEALGQVLTAMFEGHRVLTALARSGREAVERCRDFDPQLLVLDLELPEGDGFAVVDTLRRDDRLRLIPLVVYTASDVDELDRRRLSLGETHFFTKARVPPQELEERVVALLDRVVERAVVA